MGLFRRRRNAIESLPRHAILAEVLRDPAVRQRHVEPAPLKLPYQPWSDEKDRLVSNTLATAPLFLVQGPPGTGKSTYVAGMIRYILSDEEDPAARILVVAHMHSAIDDLTRRVQEQFDGTSDPWNRPLLLRLLTPRTEDEEEKADKEMADKARALFSDCLEVLEARRGESVYDAASRSLSLELRASRPSEELEERMIEAANIIFTTCTDRHLDNISRTEFDWVIIEEAGRLVGCDLIIPMRLGHRWVLIGDPKQIGTYRKEDFSAVIRRHLDEAVKRGELDEVERDRLSSDCQRLLGSFETLFLGLNSEQREKLTQQHRMHPQICRLVSKTFYDGDLTDDRETAGRLSFLFDDKHPFLANRAVLWLDIPHLHWPNNHSCTEKKEHGGFSFANPAEILVLRSFLHHLSEYPLADLPETPFTLAAISPYKSQRQALSHLLHGGQLPEWVDRKEKSKPRAFTVTAYQGQEADIVLLSMVRNNLHFDMGFLDGKQMNVAISRAKRLLVVVGCFAMLEERAKSPHADDSFLGRLVQELRTYVVPAHDLFPEVLQ
jgi:AAA domain